MRPPTPDITAPLFPPRLPWFNAAPLRMEGQMGHPVLVEFWDFCRPNSMRTLPYVKEWYARYEPFGLRVIGIHTPGFAPSADPDAVGDAVRRLQIPYPVVLDATLEIWQLYGNLGWPARYLFNQNGFLHDYHYGEGGYAETEAAIQDLLGESCPPPAPVAPLRPEDAPGAVLTPQSDDVLGPYSGPYEAGGVWAVLEGHGTVTANDRTVPIDHPGAYQLISHPHSATGELALTVGDGVICHAVCFTPGLTA